MGNKTEIFITLQNEITKDHLEFDLAGRVAKIYSALSDAVTGDVCLVKELIYYGSTITIKGRKEGYGVWDSAFDNPPLVSEFLTDESTNRLTDESGNHLTGLF